MDFIDRISVTCFAASYAVGLAAELARIYQPRRWIRWLATAFGIAGFIAQSLFLLSIIQQERHLPIATRFESIITVSWFVSIIYVYLLLRDRRLASGVILLPINLGLLVYAATLPQGVARAEGPAGSRIIGAAHGVLLLAGTAAVVVAFAVAIMYLVKNRQLKVGTASGSFRLPSLERLEAINTVAIYAAWPMLTIGILLGIAMQALPWSDPKVVTTLVAWMLFTVLAHYRYRPEHRGRRVAVLTVVACIVVFVSVFGDPIFGTGHQSTLEALR